MADDVQNWAGLVGVATTTVGQFVDDIYQQRNITYETTKAFGGIPYIFDEGLANKGRNGCPKLLNDLTIPKYFTQDIRLIDTAGLSMPTHTPIATCGVIPINQASVKLLVVPVLPATGL